MQKYARKYARKYAHVKNLIFGGGETWKTESLEWTDGCLSSREIPILYWNGLIERPELAASHTLEKCIIITYV